MAGARATLLSLWEVDDAATKVFMVNDYTLLQQGEGRAEALREVQQKFRNRTIKSQLPADDWSHPHYWAAWQLSCEGNPLPKGDRSSR